ncbi:MAG: immunoglobulin domain-containing protein, partial [Verrucomicrobiales bacterium]|nr:immunoglobulin domain-containing protein [Verrucomicrobiales bacterium]
LPLANATNSSLTIPNAQPSNGGVYYVEVLNAAGSALSSNALLTVNVPPSIDVPPQSLSVRQGSNATFSVIASGTAPLAYQWWFNTAPIAGATGNSFTRTNAQLADQGNYFVVVTNVAGAVTSPPALLSVTLPVPAHFEWIGPLPDGRIRLIWTGEPGLSYWLEAATNVDFSDWTALGPISGSNGWFEFVDAEATNHWQRFYRAREQ